MALDGSRVILGHHQDSPQMATHYRYSALSTSKLRIPLHGQVDAGDIGIYYLEEFVSTVNGEGSSVECWVDNNYGGAKVIKNAADVGDPTLCMSNLSLLILFIYLFLQPTNHQPICVSSLIFH